MKSNSTQIPMKTTAVVFRQASKPTLEEIEIPEPGPSDVLLKVDYSGVSPGTEVSIITGRRTHNGTFPLVSGYMASGTVMRAGADVKHIKPGDRVAGFGTRINGDVKPVWGGHAAHHVCDASSLTLIPAGCDQISASMWILPCVGLNSVSMANITEKDTVVISGQGLIGQFFAQWAVARGARVIAIEPDQRRAALTRQYVGCEVINPLTSDVATEVERLTSGAWPTVVVEATANARLIGQTSSLIRRMHARMIFLSWYPGKIEVDFSHLHNWEVTTFFPMGAGDDKTARAVVDGFAQGTIRLGDNLTNNIPFEQAPQAMQRVAEEDRSILGMVIDWRAHA